MPSGDDLEDDYVSDSDLVLASEGAGGSVPEENDEFQGLGLNFAISQVNLSKKRKRREKEKEKKAKRRKPVAAQGIVEAPCVASQTPADVLKYISEKQAKAFPKLSTLELEELRLSHECLADTSSYNGARTLDHIGEFILSNVPHLMVRLGQRPRDNAAPTLIFIAGAALRVADVARALRKHRGEKGGEVAKLFARHFKLKEHIAYLRKTKIGAAVGTPARLAQLLEEGALDLTALTHIIMDITHRDAKKRSILDIPETRDDILRGIFADENIRATFRSGKLKLVLF